MGWLAVHPFKHTLTAQHPIRANRCEKSRTGWTTPGFHKSEFGALSSGASHTAQLLPPFPAYTMSTQGDNAVGAPTGSGIAAAPAPAASNAVGVAAEPAAGDGAVVDAPVAMVTYMRLVKAAAENPDPPPTSSELGEALKAALDACRGNAAQCRTMVHTTVELFSSGSRQQVQVCLPLSSQALVMLHWCAVLTWRCGWSALFVRHACRRSDGSLQTLC